MENVGNGKRRKILQFLLGTGVSASFITFLYPIIAFLLPPKTRASGPNYVEAGALQELPVNSGKVFQFGSQPSILVRTAEGELRAFNATCTHLGCTVQYVPESKVIWCPCHNGMFDLHGRVIAGPAPRPLQEHKVNVLEGKIIVSRA
ncbi:MAG: hypothetical protein A3F68_12540 [Acidobacteria bacterium RIFCSPLOWO2_12_FULL_54_10]|nr:MAG: hypothetical protein A3F68_12540 [Acidobacteria bacterium RIFCSPLOWO2_12_FULL_54_10]